MDDRFLAHLPIGVPSTIPDGAIPGWEIFPFEGEQRLKALEPPELPEPPRNGEAGPDGCFVCEEPMRRAIWSDEQWVLRHLGEPSAAPVVLMLCPLAHHDLTDLPPHLAAALGPMLQRVERAIMSLGGIGRVHAMKIGDGAAHLHFWFMSRPAGLMQLRGSCLTIWDDVLPKQPETQWHQVLREVATAMAAGGGTTV